MRYSETDTHSRFSFNFNFNLLRHRRFPWKVKMLVIIMAIWLSPKSQNRTLFSFELREAPFL